jgi:hypothetical protein
MANVTISQLPTAGAITGTELVPVVQNGVTVQTTTGAIAASPAQTQTFLTLNQEPSLPNSRYLSGGTGVGLTDGGAQSFYRITLNGASGSLETAGNGVIVKTGSTTVTNRTLTASGNGIGITNGDGVSGNPTFALTGLALALANASGTGMLAVVGGTTIAGRQITGTTNQINVANGNGSNNPTISISDNVVLPGTSAFTMPQGTNAEQPVGAEGQMRFNTSTLTFDGYASGQWRQFSLAGGVISFSAGSTGFTPSSATTGAVVLSGILNPASGGTGVNNGSRSITIGGNFSTVGAFNLALNLTGATSITLPTAGTVATLSNTETLTNKTMSGTANTFSDIGNASLTNSSVTYNGVTVALGASGTITASTTAALTAGTGLQLNSGTTFDGSTAKTISIDSTVVTLTGTQTLTNKTLTTPVIAQIINTGTLTLPTSTDTLVGRATTDTLTNKTMSGASNTFTNIPNSALTNSSITLGTTNIALGATELAPAGLTSVTVTQDPVSNLQLATKQYVDTLVSSGIHFHTPVRVESPTPLNATYNQPGGAGVGVGATLTNAGTQAALVIDGVTVAVNDRVLIYTQTNATQNGVYVVTNVGSGSTNWVLTRSSDTDTYGIVGPTTLSEGSTFFVQQGTTGAGETYTCNTQGVIVFGTTNINFVQISATQIYSAGTGLNLTGTTFSIANTAVTAGTYGTDARSMTLAVNAQGQITSLIDQPISINGNQITSGTVGSAYISGSYTGITGVGTLTAGTWNAGVIGVAYGGTSYASYTTGDLLYASGSTALSKLSIGTSTYIMTSSGSAPQWSDPTGITVGAATNATNATNVGLTASTTNADFYLPLASASTSGNYALQVASGVTVNPSTGKITNGISGGTF